MTQQEIRKPMSRFDRLRTGRRAAGFKSGMLSSMAGASTAGRLQSSTHAFWLENYAAASSAMAASPVMR